MTYTTHDENEDRYGPSVVTVPLCDGAVEAQFWRIDNSKDYELHMIVWGDPYSAPVRGESAAEAVAFLFGGAGLVPAKIHPQLWPSKCPLQGHEVEELLSSWIEHTAERELMNGVRDEGGVWAVSGIPRKSQLVRTLQAIVRGEE